MLRPAGYFRELPCPFDQKASGGCQRPYCQYKHGLGGRREAQSSATCPPLTCSTSQQELALGKNMQELERINKAIETVKTEMEEKQKKLSQYKQVAKDETSNSSKNWSDLNGNSQECCINEHHNVDSKDNCSASSMSSNSKKRLHSVSNKKYVVDHSCPATDLEYDPLLNYSAGISSVTKREVGNEKSKSKHLKIWANKNRCSSTHKRPRTASPVRLEIKLQESDDDDDVLVIDVPPLEPISKKSRLKNSNKRQKNSHPVCEENPSTNNSLSEPMKGMETNKIGKNTDSEPNDNSNFYLTVAVEKQQNMSLAQNMYSSNFMKSNIFTENKEIISDMKHSPTPEMGKTCLAYDIKKNTCESNEQKHTILGSIQTDLQQVKTGHENLCISTIPKIEACQDISVEGTSGTCTDPKALDFGKVHTFPGSIKAKTLEKTCLNDETTFLSEESNFCDSISCETEVTSNLCNKETNDTVYTKVNENEIIVVDSSSEDITDVSDHDMEVSDSDDPMEECLRIFNEFAENELQKEEMAKQALAEDNTQVDLPDGKAVDNSGQKKRIAHPAKFEAKANQEILVPLKGPVPQQMYNSRILQAQQHAVQITAAVKSGQTFVATTSAQQKIPGFPATNIHGIDKIVCINLLGVQPAVSSGSHSYGVFQGHSITDVTYRRSIPLRKMIQLPPPKVITRKRPSVIPEAGAKVPHDTRQRYVNFFVEEFLKICKTVEEAFEKALSEEKAIYDRCGSKNMYLNIAVNTLKKLRDQGNRSSNNLQMSSKKNNTTKSRKHEEKNDLTGVLLYKFLKDYTLSEEQLEENGYPRLNPDKPGSAITCTGLTKSFVTDALRRICCRCGETYSVTSKGKHVRKEECNYHSGKVLRHRVPGGMETRYSCCEAVVGTSGCQVAKLHVHDGQKENLDGFMKTFTKLLPPDGNPGVFALDCEMCYTTQGLELTRVTVVDSSLQIVYDTFVKPDNEIIDYNTRFSGVTEDDLKNIITSIRDVQAVMLNMFSAESVLIGHSLENDLFALKLIHDNVVDTSVVFPHRLGSPNKRALRNLIADYLRRIIQDDVDGHNCVEDATACMELMIWKVKEDTKGRR